MSAKQLCIYAAETDEYHGYECGITEGTCVYYRPDQDACADEYGEVGHTNKWLKEHNKTE